MRTEFPTSPHPSAQRPPLISEQVKVLARRPELISGALSFTVIVGNQFVVTWGRAAGAEACRNPRHLANQFPPTGANGDEGRVHAMDDRRAITQVISKASTRGRGKGRGGQNSQLF